MPGDRILFWPHQDDWRLQPPWRSFCFVGPHVGSRLLQKVVSRARADGVLPDIDLWRFLHGFS